MAKTQVIIAAAGAGVRLGCAGAKALVPLAGKPMLARTLPHRVRRTRIALDWLRKTLVVAL